jgi:hypothetical protein|tara:strand:+ start:6511 stop:7374 length:864 start_codon:yes stop_codon:yes gene_type:complete
MALDRVHSSETQLFYTGVRIPAIQSINFSTEKQTTDIRPLGRLSYGERILNSNQTASFTYSNLITIGASGQDPFYNYQLSDSGFMNATSYGFNIKDFAGQNTITGAYLSSYSLKGAVGSFVEGESSYVGEVVSFEASNSIGFDNMSSDSFDIFRPRDISIVTSGSISTDGVESISTANLSIQSFDISVATSRQPINRLGSRTPEFRYPSLPIDGTLNVSFLKTSVTGIDMGPLVLDTGTITVELKDDADDTIMRFINSGCSLKSVSEGVDLDGNNVLNFSYVICIKK